ncbi:MAG: Holliday junction resolvase RuvX [Actinomycetota bacterium]|nr:Holliday junction resolvase RuvX [Actinomycetota bacterium]
MRIIALDFGRRRIGVAISDPSGKVARPLTVIERKNTEFDIQRISELVEEYDAEEVVVGLPITLSGKIGPQAQEVLKYVDELKKVVKIPIMTWDERLTTAYADRFLREAELRHEKKKRIVDKLAASIILQSYIDSKR